MQPCACTCHSPVFGVCFCCNGKVGVQEREWGDKRRVWRVAARFSQRCVNRERAWWGAPTIAPRQRRSWPLRRFLQLVAQSGDKLGQSDRKAGAPCHPSTTQLPPPRCPSLFLSPTAVVQSSGRHHHSVDVFGRCLHSVFPPQSDIRLLQLLLGNQRFIVCRGSTCSCFPKEFFASA
jgi:hypothetical protein